MAEPIIPGSDDEEITVGERISGFMADLGKGALIGAVLGGRLGTWGMIAGLVVGSVIGGYKTRDRVAPNGRIRMEEEYEEVFGNTVHTALQREVKGGLASRINTRDLTRTFHGDLTGAKLAPRSKCYAFCDRIGEKDPALRKMCADRIYAKCYKLAKHWNTTKTMESATRNPV